MQDYRSQTLLSYIGECTEHAQCQLWQERTWNGMPLGVRHSLHVTITTLAGGSATMPYPPLESVTAPNDYLHLIAVCPHCHQKLLVDSNRAGTRVTTEALPEEEQSDENL